MSTLGAGRIRHTVAFVLGHPEGSPAETDFLSAVKQLAAIPGLEAFELLREVSPKNPYRFGLSMEFADRDAYTAYNEHPDHVRFVQKRWLPEVTDFVEVDYEVMGGAMDLQVADAAEDERYELRADGSVAGFTAYGLRPGLIAFTHTEVAAELEGHGAGSRLARFALDDARGRHLGVLPFCPFIEGWMQRHREYADLVPEAQRGHFGL